MSRIAGQRPPRREQDALTVDYADVLRQAVDNERWRVLREVLAVVNAIPDSKARTGSYITENRPGPAVKNDILTAINRIGDPA